MPHNYPEILRGVNPERSVRAQDDSLEYVNQGVANLPPFVWTNLSLYPPLRVRRGARPEGELKGVRSEAINDKTEFHKNH
jgi:hypothetical protein